MATPTVVTPKQLGQGFPTDTNNLTIYSSLASGVLCIQAVDICNVTASGALARLFFVPPGGSASTSNAIFYDISVPANSTVSWAGPHYLTYNAASPLIVVRSSVASALCFTASGQELT